MTSKQWHLIKILFQEAESLPEAEWKNFIDKRCDDKMVSNKVIEMLSVQSQADDFLETQKLNVNLVSYPEENTDRYIGQQIGLYKIEKHVGEGGMGNVYLAERDDDFHKKVAIKIIKRGMDTDALLKRFRQERQILANLVHPNIARLLDGGSTEDGLPYLVMEYIEGLPIIEYCDQHRASISQRLELFNKVCQAVSYAHQNLVVHRDIKPNNIIVANDGTPKLLDFGIAKLLDTQNDSINELTIEGARISTPEYASPEQIQGKSITTASDIYSLGVLLYNLLTGHRPYHFLDRSPTVIESVITSTMPDLPSVAYKNTNTRVSSKTIPENATSLEVSQLRGLSPEKLRRRIDGDLDNILIKSLQKEPSRRYSSIEQFSDDINRHLSGLPVYARKDSVTYRTSKFIKRHRFGVSAVVLLLVTLLFGIAGVLWQNQLAREEAAKSQQTLEFVKKMLSSADPFEAGKKLTVEQLLDEATKRIPKELQDQPEIESEIRSILGGAYQHLAYYEKAKDHYKENLSLLEKLYGQKHSLVANALRELAVVEHYIGDFKNADSLYRKAIGRYREIGETNSVDYATALNDFGTMELDNAHYDSAIVLFESGLKIYRSLLGVDHFQNGSVLNNLAYAYDDKGDYKRADTTYQQALSVFRLNYGAEHPEIARTLNNYAFVKLNVADSLASLQLHEQALAMWRKLVGNESADVAITLHNVAAVNFYLKNYEIAEQKEKEVIEIFSKIYEKGHPNIGSAYFMMGRILNGQKKYDEARKYLQESLAIRKSKLEPGHPMIAAATLELGDSYFGNRNWKKAEDILLEAHRFYLYAGNTEKAGLKKTRLLLVKLYEKTEKPKLAAKYQKRL